MGCSGDGVRGNRLGNKAPHPRPIPVQAVGAGPSAANRSTRPVPTKAAARATSWGMGEEQPKQVGGSALGELGLRRRPFLGRKPGRICANGSVGITAAKNVAAETPAHGDQGLVFHDGVNSITNQSITCRSHTSAMIHPERRTPCR